MSVTVVLCDGRLADGVVVRLYLDSLTDLPATIAYDGDKVYQPWKVDGELTHSTDGHICYVKVG